MSEFNEGLRERDLGMERVANAAPPEHRLALLQAIRAVATRQPLMSGDDIWDELHRTRPDLVLREKRLLGPVVKTAETLNLIKPTGKTGPSRRRSRHAGKVSYYVSLLHPDSKLYANDMAGMLLVQLQAAQKRIEELEKEVALLRVGPDPTRT